MAHALNVSESSLTNDLAPNISKDWSRTWSGCSHASAQITKEALLDAKKKIYSWDLTSTHDRMTQIYNWRSEEALAAIKQYRNYLFLRRKYPEEYLPPSSDIDEAWHAHVLHTREYRAFCKSVFPDFIGSYLDHHPHLSYAGSREVLKKGYQNTKRLYREEFGCYIQSIKTKRALWAWLDTCIKAITGFRVRS